MMFQQGQQITYQHEADGTWGTFATPAGRVSYLMTKARLGTTGIDKERRLTGQLRPVREVLKIETLNFNQLLQRDLDDHRVASALIPYLLKARPTGPSFFPPIVAALLPFTGVSPVDNYPLPENEPITRDGNTWIETRFGSAFAVRRLAFEDGRLHDIKFGSVAWNEEQARLMVIDGQHRAMALLAIERTVAASWDKEGANRFKHFYEQQVRDLLKDRPELNLNEIEVPVTIVWFPDLRPGVGSVQKAARQLFVDVNKEARTPSEARLILLSDAELVNVLTRSLLNELRTTRTSLPLFAIEYDNPLKDAELPARWSVLTNIYLLKMAVTACVFGPRKYAEKVDVRFGGRPPREEMDEWARIQLDVASIFPDKIDDGEHRYDRGALGNTNFPVGQVDKLVDRFQKTWGGAILDVLSRLSPYEAHVKALQDVYDGWATDDALGSLAKDALFEGVGMYWTLRNSYLAWQEHRDSVPPGQPPPPKTDVAKAWELVAKKEEDFEVRRTQQYLGRANQSDVKRANAAYDVYNTHACQLGAILTISALRAATNTAPADVLSLGKKIVDAWNAALNSEGPNGKERRTFLSREAQTPVNMMGKMDTPLAMHFRYIWLELLRVPAAQAVLGGAIDPTTLKDLAETARRLYLRYLEQEQLKAYKRTHPDWSLARQTKRAHEEQSGRLKKALTNWFGVTEAEFEVWLGAGNGQPGPSNGTNGDEGEEGSEDLGAVPGDSSAPEAADKPADIIEELKETDDEG